MRNAGMTGRTACTHSPEHSRKAEEGQKSLLRLLTKAMTLVYPFQGQILPGQLLLGSVLLQFDVALRAFLEEFI